MNTIPLSDPVASRLMKPLRSKTGLQKTQTAPLRMDWSRQVAELEHLVRVRQTEVQKDAAAQAAIQRRITATRRANAAAKPATQTIALKLLALFADGQGHLYGELLAASRVNAGNFSRALNQLIANKQVIRDLYDKPVRYYLNRA